MKRTNYILILSFFSIGTFLLFIITCNRTFENIALSIFTSSIFALLVETGTLFHDLYRFSFLSGKWIRKDFFNRNGEKSGIGYDNLGARYSPEKVDPNIILNYKGDGEYHGTAFYENGRKTFIILIDKNNTLSASGIYQYDSTKSQNELPDIGRFDIIIDVDKKSMYVTHENILPNGNARGIEVWKRN